MLVLYCVIIFAYGILKCLLDKTFKTILRIFYQYRPRFHTETRRAKIPIIVGEYVNFPLVLPHTAIALLSSLTMQSLF
ncbi:MAG: hypothetical protein EWV54_13600 [Microcystis novacekii Mn_MB_F_20050700_S1D]|uniref:Uncharacterized protein n=1 Tax=Microcystis novacekii Mn_MB_F_20050700_S1D TaxID=2486266 RepID=A0A552ITN1_9CHRO|nr:MAG: hypothetical protein EWV54_13600 [Microcystis novacekii Mn_MB_F_20050700_S1D]